MRSDVIDKFIQSDETDLNAQTRPINSIAVTIKGSQLPRLPAGARWCGNSLIYLAN